LPGLYKSYHNYGSGNGWHQNIDWYFAENVSIEIFKQAFFVLRKKKYFVLLGCDIIKQE
jgi:hypothetical protein